jgi:hypothetical protein
MEVPYEIRCASLLMNLVREDKDTYRDTNMINLVGNCLFEAINYEIYPTYYAGKETN